MNTSAVNTPILIMCMILIISSVDVFFLIDMIHTDESHVSLHREPFTLAATYEPGEYPSGLTLVDGDVLNATNGGSFNVTGNFTIVSGATVTIVPGYKIVVYADNIIINGTLDCDYTGYVGGSDYGEDGNCVPTSGGGKHGEDDGGGGGGGAHGSNGTDGEDCGSGADGGSGGLEYGETGFANFLPTASDISLGAGGGVGGTGDGLARVIVGGAGGGGVYLEATDTISVSGVLTCDGENGGNGETGGTWIGEGGGGGGAGGGILLFGDIIQISGELTTVGGSGGLGYDPSPLDGGDGGAGSGGRIKIAYSTSLNTTGSTILEGSGGTLHTCHHDIVKPTIELTGAANNTIHRSATPIFVNISDSRNVSLISYNWDYNTNTTILLNDSSYELGTLLPAHDGVHILEVFAQDLVGNWNHQIFTFISDDTSPIILLSSPSNNTVHQSGSVIDIAVFDVYLDEVLFNWDSIGDNDSLPEPYEVLLPSGDGQHNLTIYARDVPGNWESESYSFVTDDTNPMITSPNDITYTEGFTGHSISWTLTDENPSTYVIIMDNETLGSDVWVSGMEVNITVDGLSLGVHVYTIIAFDMASNLIIDIVVVKVESIPSTTTTTTTTVTTPETTTTPISPLFDAEILTLMLASGIGGAAVVVIIVLIINRKRG